MAQETIIRCGAQQCAPSALLRPAGPVVITCTHTRTQYSTLSHKPANTTIAGFHNKRATQCDCSRCWPRVQQCDCAGDNEVSPPPFCQTSSPGKPALCQPASQTEFYQWSLKCSSIGKYLARLARSPAKGIKVIFCEIFHLGRDKTFTFAEITVSRAALLALQLSRSQTGSHTRIAIKFYNCGFSTLKHHQQIFICSCNGFLIRFHH